MGMGSQSYLVSACAQADQPVHTSGLPCKPEWRHPEAGNEFSDSQHRPHLQWGVTAGQLFSLHQDHKARYVRRGPIIGAYLENRKTRTMFMKPYQNIYRRSIADIMTKTEVSNRALAATAGHGINAYPIEVLPQGPDSRERTCQAC